MQPEVFVVVLIEDSVDSNNSNTFVHKTIAGAYRKIIEYIEHLRTYEWTTEMPVSPSFQEFTRQLHASTDPICMYTHGNYATDRFTIECMVQRTAVSE
jgi:hypothetical protein